MIWYCDTETVQISTDNIDKLPKTMYSNYIKKRLELSEEFVKRMYKEIEDDYKKDVIELGKRKVIKGKRTLLTLNVFNAGINENNVIVTSKKPDIFLQKIAKETKKAGGKTCTVYYHNLKFDMTNIIDYLKVNDAKFKFQNSLIVGTKWYNYRFFYCGVLFSFLDSYNLTMSKLKDFGKAFGLPDEFHKTEYEFDFNKLENIVRMMKGDKILEDYCIQDVRCLKAGVEAFKKFAKADKITLASTAFENWKNTNHPPLVKLTLEEQLDANLTYTGAICYANPMYQGELLEGKFVYIDNNGLYSAAGYSECAGFKHPYPVGMGTRKTGTPDIWNIHKYYTIRATIKAVAKSDTTIPFFRLGKQSALGQKFKRMDSNGRAKPYKQNEYLSVVDETCYINSIDLRLLHKYYHIDHIEYDYFWEYETCMGIFDEYTDYWIEQKTIGTRTHNMPLKTVAKFMNNSLTGKFGQNIEPVETILDWDEKTKILEHKHKKMDKEPQFIYMPIVSAILSYAREIFLDMTESYPKEHFIYCDTDSNIMTREAFFKYVDKKKMSRYKLGFWDIEQDIIKLKVVRQKTYMFTTKRGHFYFDENGEKHKTEHDTIVKCAGATEEVKKYITYDNFEVGNKIKGAKQLKPRLIPGGTALIEQPFVLRQLFRGV